VAKKKFWRGNFRDSEQDLIVKKGVMSSGILTLALNFVEIGMIVCIVSKCW